jgi:hypothetical protein
MNHDWHFTFSSTLYALGLLVLDLGFIKPGTMALFPGARHLVGWTMEFSGPYRPLAWTVGKFHESWILYAFGLLVLGLGFLRPGILALFPGARHSVGGIIEFSGPCSPLGRIGELPRIMDGVSPSQTCFLLSLVHTCNSRATSKSHSNATTLFPQPVKTLFSSSRPRFPANS